MPLTDPTFTTFLKLIVLSSGLIGGEAGREVICFKMKTEELGNRENEIS